MLQPHSAERENGRTGEQVCSFDANTAGRLHRHGGEDGSL